MILGFKRGQAGDDSFWYGKIGENRSDTKFARVIAGVALPMLDRIKAAVVVVGETYRVSGPASWIVLAATCGACDVVQNAMSQYRQDLKFNYVIVGTEQERTVIWENRSLQFGMKEIPFACYPAPYWASGEMGRSYTNELLAERRLSISDAIQNDLEKESQMGALALNLITAWTSAHLNYYAPTRERQRGPYDILGQEGL